MTSMKIDWIVMAAFAVWLLPTCLMLAVWMVSLVWDLVVEVERFIADIVKKARKARKE